MAPENKEESPVVNMTQQVNKKAKIELNKLNNMLGAYALSKGIKEPKKGEILSKLISEGFAKYENDHAAYFQQHA